MISPDNNLLISATPIVILVSTSIGMFGFMKSLNKIYGWWDKYTFLKVYILVVYAMLAVANIGFYFGASSLIGSG